MSFVTVAATTASEGTPIVTYFFGGLLVLGVLIVIHAVLALHRNTVYFNWISKQSDAWFTDGSDWHYYYVTVYPQLHAYWDDYLLYPWKKLPTWISNK